MKFWFRRSENEKGTVYAGAEHGSLSGFAALHVGGRELLHAASLVGAAWAMKRLSAGSRQAARTQKAVRGREKRARKTLRTAPRRTFGARGGLSGKRR